MRFILTATGMNPTDGALIPNIIERSSEVITHSFTDLLLNWIGLAGTWLAHYGLPMAAEGLLIWSMFCILMAITGKGTWMERAVKSFVGFVLVGVAAHAL